VGFSLAFGESLGGVIGNPFTYLGLRNVGVHPNPAFAATIPFALFVLFQMKFAIITPALITGAFAERVRFKSYLIFCVFFSLFIYTPLAHWAWHPEGFLRKWGVLDFAGGTGHAEAIKIQYDEKVISYQDLLTVFFYTHDPTTLNRQGNDVGTQYRSAIFYGNEEEKQKAEDFINQLTNESAYKDKIVTEVSPLTDFYEAEDYHHDYYESHKDEPYCNLVIAPKVEKFEKRFKELIK
jgi:methionine-S-sulfoxide reductase